MNDNFHQIIIIGASAAGISSSLYLKRREADFQLLARDIGGEMALSGIIENYPGFPETNGVELTEKFKEHLKKYQIQPIIEEVISLEKENNYFLIKTNKNNFYKAKIVILATGSSPKKLNIPGEKEFYHKGISYCSICDLPLFAKKTVAIIGGGNSSLEAGLMASKICNQAYIINKNLQFKGEQVLVNELLKKNNVQIIYNALTQEFYGQEFLQGLRYLDKDTNKIKYLQIDGVFIHIGLKPNTQFISEQLKIKNEYEEIVVDKFCQTNIPGLFAAGDCTDIPFKQIGIAVGQGIIAALQAAKYLN